MVRNVADIYQSGQYSMAAQKVKRAQGALNILSNSGKSGLRDMVHISDTARTYSKEYIVALTNTCHDVSASDFSFYFDNYNNMPALLDAINFNEDIVFGSYTPELKEFGALSFKLDGIRQLIPNYAVPKINACTLPAISAENNKLILEDKGYYCYTAKNGKKYTWSVHNGNVGWATSEKMLSEDGDLSAYNYRWEMHRAGDLLSRLAKGNSTYGFLNEELKETLSGFGITEGHFTIDAGAGTRHYMLLENGVVIDIDKRIELMNSTDWKEQGYQTGDVINVYGKECVIDEEGHIQVSAEDEFTDTKIRYPDGKTL